jgi:hypothetical protein
MQYHQDSTPNSNDEYDSYHEQAYHDFYSVTDTIQSDTNQAQVADQGLDTVINPVGDGSCSAMKPTRKLGTVGLCPTDAVHLELNPVGDGSCSARNCVSLELNRTTSDQTHRSQRDQELNSLQTQITELNGKVDWLLSNAKANTTTSSTHKLIPVSLFKSFGERSYSPVALRPRVKQYGTHIKCSCGNEFYTSFPLESDPPRDRCRSCGKIHTQRV